MYDPKTEQLLNLLTKFADEHILEFFRYIYFLLSDC